MASNSKSITLYSSNGKAYYLQAYFNEESTNTPQNSSRIYVEAKLTSTGYRWTSNYNSYLRIYWHDNRENYDRLVAETALTSIANNGSAYASGYIDPLYHNSDGGLSGYAYATFTKGGTSAYTPSDGSVSTDWTVLTSIPRQASITSAPDFNDESNPTVNYSNPAGDAVSQLVLGIHDINGSVAYAGYRDVPKTGTSYTFNLTDDERIKLRQACTGNSMQVKFYLRTTIGGTYYYSSVTKTMTIVNGEPTFNNFEFADVNEKTVALTGSNTSIVKGYSNVKVTIPSSMKATANKEASLSKYRVSIGTANPTDITYSSDSDVNGTVNNADSSTINVYAIDSRNNSKLVSKQATNFIPYSVVTKVNIDVGRTNGVSEDVTLKINGTYSNIDFGQVVNSIKSAQYRYRVKGTNEWSDYKDLNLTTSGNNFSYDGLIRGDTESLGFNISNSYDIEVLVKDELSEVTFTDTFGSGIPNIALAKNGVGIMGKYDENVGGLLQVGGNQVIENKVVGDNACIKFYDGTMIQTGYKNASVSVTNAWGYLYTSGTNNFVFDDFIEQFIETPKISYAITAGDWTGFLMNDQVNLVSKKSPGGIQIGRGTETTRNFGVSYIAIGRWK